MRVEAALGVAMALVVVASAVVAVAVPGALAGAEPEPGHARLTDLTVATGKVAPETATLTVTAYLRHEGGRSENLSVRVRATHIETGMLATTESVNVQSISGETELQVPLNVTVPREGGYRITVFLYEGGQRRGDVTRAVRGVGALQPPSTASSVRFHSFDRKPGNDTLPSVQTSVAQAGDQAVTLNVSAYLTNEGATVTGDLSVQFVLRQAESGLVAARTRVPIGAVPAQHTVTPSAPVSVPAGYNYYVDAILWKGGVIVDSARGVANLDPDRSIRVNRSGQAGGLQVSDFERDRGDAAEEPTPRPAGTPASSPGFGPVVALLALGGVALLARRHA